MNVYDFDKTIYDGDSTVDFFRFCLGREKRTWLSLPKTGLFGLPFLLGLYEKTAFKQVFFQFLRQLEDTEAAVEAFWASHRQGIKAWYRAQERPDDLIISASPAFLLGPVVGEDRLIASLVDPVTGQFDGLNCFGEEKVVRFQARFPGVRPQAFYSDSLSDAPMARLAHEAYAVEGDRILPWEAYFKTK